MFHVWYFGQVFKGRLSLTRKYIAKVHRMFSSCLEARPWISLLSCCLIFPANARVIRVPSPLTTFRATTRTSFLLLHTAVVRVLKVPQFGNQDFKYELAPSISCLLQNAEKQKPGKIKYSFGQDRTGRKTTQTADIFEMHCVIAAVLIVRPPAAAMINWIISS